MVTAAPRRFLSWLLVTTILLFIAEWGVQRLPAAEAYQEFSILSRTSAYSYEVLVHAALPLTSLLAALCKIILLSLIDLAFILMASC